MRRPLFYPLIALIAGILAGDYILLHYSALAVLSLAILVVLFFTIRKKWNVAALALVLSLIFMTGLFSISRHQYGRSESHHILHHANQEKMTIEGVVISEKPVSPEKSLLLVDCVRQILNKRHSRLSGYIRLVIPAGLSLERQDFIRFRTTVKTISGFQNPGGFDYRQHLSRQGIFVSGFISGPQDIILIRHRPTNTIPVWIDSFRNRLKRLIYTHVAPGAREILEAMTIGNQNSIPPDIQDAFAKTGTAHILSISGLHVGLVASAGFILALWLLKTSEYLMLRFNIIKIAASLSFIPVMIYTPVAGMGTPVLRSAFMVLAFLMALTMGKIRDLYNILFAAAIVILIMAPESLFDISFQMSFSSVFALIYIVPRFARPAFSFLSDTPFWLQTAFRKLYLFMLVSLTATIGTLPIMIYYFNRMSTVTLFANLIAVPLLGMVTLFFILLFIVTALFFTPAAVWMIKIASFFASPAVEIIKQLAAIPWSSVTFPKPSGMEMILFYIVLFGLVEMLTPAEQKTEKNISVRHPILLRATMIASIALLVGHGVYLHVKDKASTDLRLTVIDVGQGSSTLIEFPGGVRMLIDGGGFSNNAFDMGKSVIAPFLYFKRIRKIDIVVLTHPHPDHLQGLIYIVKNFDVREVWTTGIRASDDLYRLWETTLADRRINIRHISSGTPPEILAGASIQCLWPDFALPPGRFPDANDQSMVLKITFGDKNFLITGDISSRVESLLIASGKDLKSDLIVVPHHGSVHASSPAFLRKVSPQFAIVSAGQNNVFHHPHPDVISRYLANGAAVFRTDRSGAVTAFSDGKTVKITPRRR